VDAYVKRPFESLRGTKQGLPFLHVGVNIVPHSFYQQQAEVFIDEFGFHVCMNDYNARPADGRLQTNAVHDLFQQPFLKPVIVIVNGVADSPTHSQWTMLLNEGGGAGSPAEWNQAILRWIRTVDSVEAPLPRLTHVSRSNDVFQFTFPGQRGRTNRVECTTDFLNWTTLTNFTGTNAPVTFRDTSALATGPRFYRLRRL